MHEFDTLEPAIDPNNRITFLLDWELTMKCNLDCDYCPIDLYGGHDNSTQHPPLDQCIKTIDFMFEYVDLYMQTKPQGLRYVILNVYGGESLHHPDIIKILARVKERYQEMYLDRWNLTITTTTNAIISNQKFDQIIPLIDEFTVSYHAQNSQKQKEQFKRNLLEIRQQGKRQKCIVLMHSDQNLFEDAKSMIDWCTQNNIKYLPRQLDDKLNKFAYGVEQVVWFEKLYNQKTFNGNINLVENIDEKTNLTNVGRACCGGRQLCENQDYKKRNFFVQNNFMDWNCSVNHFFLYIKQVNGEIFTNKDCKMNFDNKEGPIGHLSDTKLLLKLTKQRLQNKTEPPIQCKKNICLCGLCAPKARSMETYNKIMEKYQLS